MSFSAGQTYPRSYPTCAGCAAFAPEGHHCSRAAAGCVHPPVGGVASSQWPAELGPSEMGADQPRRSATVRATRRRGTHTTLKPGIGGAHRASLPSDT